MAEKVGKTELVDMINEAFLEFYEMAQAGGQDSIISRDDPKERPYFEDFYANCTSNQYSFEKTLPKKSYRLGCSEALEDGKITFGEFLVSFTGVPIYESWDMGMPLEKLIQDKDPTIISAIKKYGLTPFIKMGVSTSRSYTLPLFEYGIPQLKEWMFRDDKTLQTFVELAETVGEDDAYSLFYSLTQLKHLMLTDDQSLATTLEMLKAAGKGAAKLLLLITGLNLNKPLDKDSCERLKKVFIEMARDAGNNSNYLFEDAIPALDDVIVSHPDRITEIGKNLIVILNNLDQKLDQTLSSSFFKNAYPILVAEGFDVLNPKGHEAIARQYSLAMNGMPQGINLRDYFDRVKSLAKCLHLSFLDTLSLCNGFVKGEKKLLDKLHELYGRGLRNLNPLRFAMEALEIVGDGSVARLGRALDLDLLLQRYRQATVEEKVLAAKFFQGYLKLDNKQLANALNLTSESVEAFWKQTNQADEKKLSDGYYSFMGFLLLGDEDSAKKVLASIDFKAVVKERMCLEIFGLMEAANVGPDVWEDVVTRLPLELTDLEVVEAVRKKLLDITKEKANQIIEQKAREYVETSITQKNIASRVRFVKVWSHPLQSGLSSGLDIRFVFDIYVQAAMQMKNKLKAYCMSERCEDWAKWEIFDSEEIKAIEIFQESIARPVAPEKKPPVVTKKTPIRAPNVTKKAPVPEPVLQPAIEPPVDRLAELRGMVFDRMVSDVTGGGIKSDVDLQNRINLYDQLVAQKLDSQLGLLREQVIGYINRNSGVLDREFIWKNGKLKLRDILPFLGIDLVGSAVGLASYLKKAMQRSLGYTIGRVGDMISAKMRDGSMPSVVEEGLHFTEGVAGEGKEQSGGTVSLERGAFGRSTFPYTVRRKGMIEAVVVQVNPSLGARFDFRVQVGATTGGNMKNLAAQMRKDHGKNMILDTVGAMVQGEGMPISMIFANGEPKNKKSTREGQRDGLVMFSPHGKIMITRKTRISYSDMARLVDLKDFERTLEAQIETMERFFTEQMGIGKPDLDQLTAKFPDKMKEYARAISVREALLRWRRGEPLNYASESSYVPQELFWKVAKFGNLGGFIESLYVENGRSQVHEEGSGAHKRLLLEFADGTYGVYDSRVAITDDDVAKAVAELTIGGGVKYAVNLDTGMADDTNLYDNSGTAYRLGFWSQPVGTNRIGIYQE